MKHWVVIILLFITALGTFIPCCEIDDCCADQAATSEGHNKHEAEGTCSPFFACATCPGFVELSQPVELMIPATNNPVHQQQVLRFYFAEFPTSFWQPPRYC